MTGAIVIIGRNEGERLRRSLASALRQCSSVIYVDSGSTDGSCSLARSLGTGVVELDATEPFTAARARNSGIEFLLLRSPAPDAVQFLDGDCELAEGWLARGCEELSAGEELGAVCGRQRERFPEASIFHRLFDLEWDAPTGEVRYFTGNVLVRAAAFRQAGGFKPELVAGEEPEFALRLRRSGWKIVRLAAEMACHDSDMTRFGQLWRRTVRSGHAYAEGAWLYGLERQRHWLRETLSIAFWGICWPLAIAALAWVSRPAAVIGAMAYPAMVLVIYLRTRRLGRVRPDAMLYAIFCMLAKFPQAIGMLRFLGGKLSGRRGRIIEYKAT